MTFDEYLEQSKRTAVELDEKNKIPQLVMSGLGTAGEAGEVADEIKKIVFHDHPINKEKLMKEMGDVLWYLARVCAILDVSFNEVAKMNVDKLKTRYPNGFEKERSLNRTGE